MKPHARAPAARGAVSARLPLVTVSAVGLLICAAPVTSAQPSAPPGSAVWTNPCTVTVPDPTGDTGMSGSSAPVPEPDTDITQVTYRLGPRYLTAVIRVPGLARHLTPAWNQRASFWDNVGWQNGETYPWEYATASRGTLPDDGVREFHYYPPMATWDDKDGVVTLRFSRNEALTTVETGRGALSAVQLDIKMSAQSEDDTVEDEIFDGVHLPLLKSAPCDAWRARLHQ